MRYIVVAIAMLSAGCEKSSSHYERGNSSEANAFVWLMMNSVYYWYDSMPTNLDGSTLSVEDYFYGLLVPHDRWSWMMDGEEYNASETGVYTSYGASIAQPIEGFNDYDIYITMVYKDSPFAAAGVTRGYRLDKINGVDAMDLVRAGTFYSEWGRSSNTFTFTDLEGNSVTKEISQSTFQSNSVVTTKIFTQSDFPTLGSTDKVGYILYSTFNSTLESELTNAIATFKNEGITDLILDLRYNGGGSLSVCTDLAGLIAPASAEGKTFISIKHNSKNSDYDASYYIKRTENSLDLQRIFVIGGPSTASASEDIINGMTPYMSVRQVGETTYGKPNGMYEYLYPQNVKDSEVEYAFLPICFYCVNANGTGDFDNGLSPEKLIYDDLYHDFGVEENSIASCLSFIATGSYPDITYSSKSEVLSKSDPRLMQGANSEGVAIDKGKRENYGSAYLPML